MNLNVRTLLFDVDNTLIDFTACEKAALQRAFDQKQIELTKEVYDRYQEINHGLWRAFERGEVTKDTVLMTRFGKLFDALGIEEDGEAFETVYQNLLGQEHVLYEDTIEVLDELKNRYDIYYLTNGVAATQASRLRLSGIDKYAKDVFVSETIGFQKPSIEFFDYCIKRMEGFEVSTGLMIGDSLTSDIKGGNNAGIRTCWLNTACAPGSQAYHVDYEIRCLRDLFRLGL